MQDLPTDPPAHVRLLIGYHGWAHARLWQSLAAVPDADYFAERRAFFGSIHGTMNHMLVADILWLDRIEGNAPSGLKLDAIVADERDDVAALRARLNARLAAAADSADAARLAAEVVYRTTKGTQLSTPLLHILVHVVNHGTHHRGQVSDMIADLERPTPEMDLIYYLREIGTTA